MHPSPFMEEHDLFANTVGGGLPPFADINEEEVECNQENTKAIFLEVWVMILQILKMLQR